MSKYKAKRTGTKVVTGKVRLSYANLFEPKGFDGNEPQYSVSLIIPKNDTDTLKAIKEAIAEAKENDKGKWNGKIPANLKTPLRDGDEERPDDEAYADSYFINANSKKKKPQVVGLKGENLGEDEVYSGCYARVSITLYGFNASGNRGIGCGLGNVQKLDDGESFGGGSSASEDFEFEDAEDDFLG